MQKIINNNPNAHALITRVLKKLIKGYQRYISSWLPARCRYYPTCSQYGLQALTWHGAMRGSLLTIKRVCSCHPLGGHGLDFVPLPLYRFDYTFVSKTSTFIKIQQQTINIARQKDSKQQAHKQQAIDDSKHHCPHPHPQQHGCVYRSYSHYTHHLNLWLKRAL